MYFYYFEGNCICYKTIYTTKKGEHFYRICHKLWTHCLKGSALNLFSLWPTRIISFLKASLQLITVGRMFLKIQPFQHLHIHHEIVMIVSILQLLRSCCFICRATNWMLEVFGGEIPIILQHLFCEIAPKEQWVVVSSLWSIQFSHVHDSSSMCLFLSIDLVFNIPCRSNQKTFFALFDI